MTILRRHISRSHACTHLACSLLIVLLSICSARAETAYESPRIAALAAALERGEADALATFWDVIARTHAPLIEPLPDSDDHVLLTFLWRTSAPHEEANVAVLSPLGRQERASPVPEPLLQLGTSDVWFRTYRASSAVRFEYALSWPQGRTPDPAAHDTLLHEGTLHEIFPDPLNPRSIPTQWDERTADGVWIDRLRRISFAEGPRAPVEPFIAQRAKVARGTVTTLELTSEVLGNTRRISIYTPPGFERGDERCDFLLLFDRAEYVLAVPTPTILDNLLADGRLRPVLAVFVGNGPGSARSAELPPNAEFQAFLRRELLPWLRQRYRFTRDPKRSVVGGSSFGGLAAAYTALENPDLFGNVLSQSGSYWWWPGFEYQGRHVDALQANAGWLVHRYAEESRKPLRFYLDAGALEGPLMLLPNRMFNSVLRARGYSVVYHEHAGAHDYVMWRSTLADGLITLLGEASR